MFRSIMKTIGRGFVHFTSGMGVLGSFWLFVLTFVMSGDVLGRYFFNQPIIGTPEIVKVSIVAIVFLMIPHTLYQERHIRSDIVLSRVRPVTREMINLPIYLLGAVVFIVIFKSSWAMAINSWEILEYEGEGALRVPTYPVRTIILLSSAATAIHFLVHFVKSIILIRNHRKGT